MADGNVDEQREHRELSEGAIKDRLKTLEVGDEILFNDRKVPLEVVEVTDRIITIKGPQGGQYKLSKDSARISRRAYGDSGRTVNPVSHETLRWVDVLDD